MLQPHVTSRVAQLRERYLSSRPFRHLVIDDFLDPEYCTELITEFPRFDEQRARNEFGAVGRKAVFPKIALLGPAYKRLDQMLQSRGFLSWMSAVTAVPKLLYDPEYVGGGTHENLSGQDLDPHVDFNRHPRTGLHRRLNLILFLNPEWEESWGGALELHLDPSLPPSENKIKTILPLANRCVLFETTEHSWHGFRRIELPEGKDLSRRSVAVYFYTKDRPVEETAPDHSTVYVQRPLPGYIRPGYTLREEDVHMIQNLLARRDTQIRFLYERELDYSRITGSRTFRLARILAWPVHKYRMLRKSAR